MKKFHWIFAGILLVATLAGAQMDTAGSGAFSGEELLPPNAKPGECYTRVFVPPQYETRTETVLKREAAERIETVPARFAPAEERVLVKEASERLEIVPATYEWAEETIMTKPASKKLVEVPAVYETVTEQVLDTPAHTVWKKGSGLIQKVDNTTGEIMCLVEVPATYKTVSKRVLKQPASVKEVEVPAQYTTVKRRVVKDPPSVRKVEIPAEYKTVKVTKMVQAPDVRRIEIPAEYQTVTNKVKISEGRMEWRSVLCETNVTGDIVRSLQRSLKNRGFDPGQIDGRIGSETMAAVRNFQRSKGLAEGNLTHETLKALGIL